MMLEVNVGMEVSKRGVEFYVIGIEFSRSISEIVGYVINVKGEKKRTKDTSLGYTTGN